MHGHLSEPRLGLFTSWHPKPEVSPDEDHISTTKTHASWSRKFVLVVLRYLYNNEHVDIILYASCSRRWFVFFLWRQCCLSYTGATSCTQGAKSVVLFLEYVGFHRDVISCELAAISSLSGVQGGAPAANAFVGHFEPRKCVWWQQNCPFCSSFGPKFYITGQEMSSKVVVSGWGEFSSPGSFMRQSASFPHWVEGRAASRCACFCSAHTDNLRRQEFAMDQSRGTVYLWHCVQVTSRRRLSEDIWRHFCLTILTIRPSYVDGYIHCRHRQLRSCSLLPSLPT